MPDEPTPEPTAFAVDSEPVTYREPSGPAAQLDPLRYCVMTTVALLAWWFGPLAVVAFSAMGLWAYGRAIRGGLARSRCVLRRPMLVMVYLGALCTAGVAAIASHYLTRP